MMDDWVPNPRARPYFPQRNGFISWLQSLLYQRYILFVIKVCLLITLIATVLINISFLQGNRNKLVAVTNAWPSSSNYQALSRGDSGRETGVSARKDVVPGQALSRGDSGRETGVSARKDVVAGQSEWTERRRVVMVEVVSSRELAAVWVNGTNVLYSDGFDVDRGIHILVLHQATGGLMTHRVFDTYQENEDVAMVKFLQELLPGRLVIFTIKDEGTFQMKDPARQYLTSLGSTSAEKLHWRDMWALVTHTNGGRLAEGYNRSAELSVWADRVMVNVSVSLKSVKESQCGLWPENASTKRRQAFCEKYAGYKDVCLCTENSTPIDYPVKQLKTGGILDVPVAVIASNRPHYLYRMLTTLLQSPGVPKDKVVVFIDGFFEEPLDITRLLDIRGIQHTPVGIKNGRISQHYKASLTAAFTMFPEAEHLIILEEDLEVSPDFFSYFQQLRPLLQDEDIYCISAWNDQGYNHSCQDPALLYRVETMPGLGWMMRRKLFMDELLPQWPSVDKQWDWDMWMRADFIRKERECIIPDVSRTYHFGSKGLNVNPYFQDIYFKSHALQRLPYVKLKDIDSMRQAPYEQLIEDLIKNAKVLNHTKDPCAEDFMPTTDDKTFVMYIQMNQTNEFTTWKVIAKCYKLWDLDVRGFHHSMWRQFHKQKQLVIVGVPASSYSKYMPADVKPIFLKPEDDKAIS